MTRGAANCATKSADQLANQAPANAVICDVCVISSPKQRIVNTTACYKLAHGRGLRSSSVKAALSVSSNQETQAMTRRWVRNMFRNTRDTNRRKASPARLFV